VSSCHGATAFVEQIEAPRQPRRDLGNEALDHPSQIVSGVATLHPLRHSGKEIAHDAILIPLALEPLTL
jgi:hypothetical protein